MDAVLSISCLSSCSYIKPQHPFPDIRPTPSCLSSCSYIKPQLPTFWWAHNFVVYHLVPTSNHNHFTMPLSEIPLFIILFLHQTTTCRTFGYGRLQLFIILFLHQTTTYTPSFRVVVWLFIILFLHQTTTPQYERTIYRCVVYHLVPTSNHNNEVSHQFILQVVYHLVPTSNHNQESALPYEAGVVYHLVPTSNHNVECRALALNVLFIILFLHQTTTSSYSSCF